MSDQTANRDDDEEALSPDDRIVQEAKRRFGVCETWEGDARKNFVSDYKFANADANNLYQWPQDVRQSRELDDRPCLTINKTRQHCLQIINDAKQNKPSVKVKPIGNGATYEASQVFEGVVRHIEYISNAQSAYDTATTFQVMGGMGYWRVVTDYAGDDTFDQEIFIRRIRDPLSVYLDPDIREADGSDAQFGFVFDDMVRKDFNKKYPKFKNEVGTSTFEEGDTWIRDDQIRVAEYYRRVPKKDRLMAFTDPQTMQQVIVLESKVPKEVLDIVSDDPATQYRDVQQDDIEWFLIAGDKIIERNVWPGKYIPIVRVVGEETIIDGTMDRKGHTRAMIDPQRVYNYWTALALPTPLPTPTGWTTMGAVRQGDLLLSEKGVPVRVLGKSPVYVKSNCFQVTFDDGTSIVSDAGHKWKVEERGRLRKGGWEWLQKVVTTIELEPKKHFIWCSEPADLPEIDLPIHPYVLGVWLGDGTSANGNITASIDDVEEMRANIAACGYEVGPTRIYAPKRAATFRVMGLLEKLRSVGVLGNKFVPEIYLRGSISQREALLQGLMDTDGSFAKKSHQCDFTNVNPYLVEAFSELVRSLGYKGKSCTRKSTKRIFPNGKEYTTQDATQFYFTSPPDREVFRLSRKRDAHRTKRNVHSRRTNRHGIKRIIPVPSVPVQCLSVDSETHLFLAGEGMVPTHNSAAVEQVALQGKTPYIGPLEAFEGLETHWQQANTTNFAYLPYNQYDDKGQKLEPPARQAPPVMSSAYIQGMQVSSQEIKEVSGQYQAELGMQSNETSGVAIQQRQRQGDNATYHYIDNLAMAVRFTGKILIDLIPKIYDTPRIIKIMAEDGVEHQVTIDPKAQEAYLEKQKEQKEVVQGIFNPNVGKYDVEADIGPAYATRRQEAFNAFMQIASQNKDLMHIAGDLMFKAADFPMADELAERLKRLIPPQVMGDAPPPEVQQMGAQLQHMQGLLMNTMQELADAKRDLKAKDEQKQIDEYKALTDRIKVLLPTVVNPKDIAVMVHDMMMAEHSSNLDLANTVSAQAVGQILQPAQPAQGQPEAPMNAPDEMAA